MNDSTEEITEWAGYKFDWNSFEIAKDIRWKYIKPHSYYCKLHDTYFDPDGYTENDCMDAEPCWACHDEFNKKL